MKIPSIKTLTKDGKFVFKRNHCKTLFKPALTNSLNTRRNTEWRSCAF